MSAQAFETSVVLRKKPQRNADYAYLCATPAPPRRATWYSSAPPRGQAEVRSPPAETPSGDEMQYNVVATPRFF
jgi:hypothetical protein